MKNKKTLSLILAVAPLAASAWTGYTVTLSSTPAENAGRIGSAKPYKTEIVLTEPEDNPLEKADRVLLNEWCHPFPFSDPAAVSAVLKAYDSDPESWHGDALKVAAACNVVEKDFGRAFKAVRKLLHERPGETSAARFYMIVSMLAGKHVEEDVAGIERDCDWGSDADLQLCLLQSALGTGKTDRAGRTIEKLLADPSIPFSGISLQVLYYALTVDDEKAAAAAICGLSGNSGGEPDARPHMGFVCSLARERLKHLFSEIPGLARSFDAVEAALASKPVSREPMHWGFWTRPDANAGNGDK